MPAPGTPDGRRGERPADRTRPITRDLQPHRSSRAAHRSPPHRAAVQMKTMDLPPDPLLGRRFPGSRTVTISPHGQTHAGPTRVSPAVVPSRPKVYFRAASKGLTRSPD